MELITPMYEEAHGIYEALHYYYAEGKIDIFISIEQVSRWRTSLEY